MSIFESIIGYPLGWLMYFIYYFIPNYGISILLFTLVIKIILFPISVHQQKSQAAMAAFNPKLEELKKKYAKNPQKLQEEQMKLYSEEGINPMASCLPTIIQLFILFGVFDVVYKPISHILRYNKDTINQAKEIAKQFFGTEKSFEHRVEPYILKAVKEHADAFSSAMPDFFKDASSFHNTFLGIDLNKIPTFHPDRWTGEAVGLIVIALSSAVLQLIITIYMRINNKKNNPAAASIPGMNAIFYFMPLLSVWISMSSPAGLGLYWTVSSLFSLIQQVILFKIYTPEYVAVLVEKDKAKKKKKRNGRPSMLEKYQQMLAEQNGTAAPAKKENDEPETEEVKLSKAKQKEIESRIIAEARRRQAEKYGDEYDDLEE
jgi:YidC/Oxa1 family membrane protein insertase